MVPYHSYNTIYPNNPILIITAPIVIGELKGTIQRVWAKLSLVADLVEDQAGFFHISIPWYTPNPLF